MSVSLLLSSISILVFFMNVHGVIMFVRLGVTFTTGGLMLKRSCLKRRLGAETACSFRFQDFKGLVWIVSVVTRGVVFCLRNVINTFYVEGFAAFLLLLLWCAGFRLGQLAAAAVESLPSGLNAFKESIFAEERCRVFLLLICKAAATAFKNLSLKHL